MSIHSKREVAVSYAWKEERDGPNAKAVDAFCAELTKTGANVIRDIDCVKNGDSLSTFMRNIGASDFICVFLSDAYLRSPNCMYELLIAWQRSKHNPDEFRRRVKVWVMPDSTSIRSTESRLTYTDHWNSERDRVAPLIAKHATDGLAESELETYRRIKQFAEHVNEMLVFFADTLSPAKAEEFQRWIQQELPVAPATVDDATLAAAYENTVSQIEETLNQHAAVGEFLQRVTTGVVQKEGVVWRLSDSVRARNFPVLSTLEAMSRMISSFSGNSVEWKSLADIAGGLVVLGIDRRWVVQQRQAARTESAEYPADEDTIRLGAGRQANLLHLVSSALADGRARLERVFGKPPLDEFRVPDVPLVQRGISAEDRNHAVKLHFIKFILGADQPINEGDRQKVDILFKRTKDVISTALRDDHTPYVATGTTFKALAETIRQHLKIEDLLLIHPSGEDPETLLQDNVRVLRFLGTIFDAVNAKSRN